MTHHEEIDDVGDDRRTPLEVSERIAALGTILWRIQLENHLFTYGGSGREEMESRNAQLAGWAEAERLAFSPREAELLARPLGAWTPQEMSELVWRFEAVAALAWSIERLAFMPPYDEPAKAVHMLPLTRVGEPLHVPEAVRADDVLHREIERASLWNWRARTETFRRKGVPAVRGDSYEATVARAVESALSDGLIEGVSTQDGDFLVCGTPYAAVEADRFIQLACIAFERHRALTWLVSRESWDDVNPPT